eukprot:366212-Chlamydomonas_euryale.AAC.45
MRARPQHTQTADRPVAGLGSAGEQEACVGACGGFASPKTVHIAWAAVAGRVPGMGCEPPKTKKTLAGEDGSAVAPSALRDGSRIIVQDGGCWATSARGHASMGAHAPCMLLECACRTREPKGTRAADV